MKKLKIGELEFDVCESAKDINDGRNSEVQKYMFQIYDGVDLFNPSKMFLQFKQAVNSDSKWEMIKVVYDAEYAFGKSNENPSIWTIIFALITVFEGEDQSDQKTRDRNYLDEKIKKLWEAGLTADVPKTECEAFFLMCPELSAIYSQIQTIRQLLTGDNLDLPTLEQPKPELSETLQPK
jgi:hypothetical protein